MKKVTTSLVLLSLLMASCGKDTQKEPQEAPVLVKEMTVGMSAADGCRSYSGTVAEENGTPLAFTVGGTVTSIRVKVGDRVSKGQLIATVDDTSLRNSLQMSRATRLQAEDAHRRLKQLHDKGSLPDIKWVEAESQLAQAQAAEKIAEKALADARLYAPYSGVISEKLSEVGQVAAPGVPVARLVTTQTLNVMLSVPEGDVAAISLGQRALVTVAALDNRAYEARVVEKGVVADAVSRSYQIKLRVSAPGKDLLPGMVTKVEMILNNPHSALNSEPSNLITVPSRLLQLADDNGCFVWVDEAGKAVRRRVTVGEFTATGVTVTQGLRPGDRIITEGQQKLCDGTAVRTEANSEK